jgi:hypothetical protein
MMCAVLAEAFSTRWPRRRRATLPSFQHMCFKSIADTFMLIDEKGGGNVVLRDYVLFCLFARVLLPLRRLLGRLHMWKLLLHHL